MGKKNKKDKKKHKDEGGESRTLDLRKVEIPPRPSR